VPTSIVARTAKCLLPRNHQVKISQTLDVSGADCRLAQLRDGTQRPFENLKLRVAAEERKSQLELTLRRCIGAFIKGGAKYLERLDYETGIEKGTAREYFASNTTIGISFRTCSLEAKSRSFGQSAGPIRGVSVLSVMRNLVHC
jgi:hypothetical protein